MEGNLIYLVGDILITLPLININLILMKITKKEKLTTEIMTQVLRSFW